MNKFNKKAISNLEGKVARGEYSALDLERLLLKGVIDIKNKTSINTFLIGESLLKDLEKNNIFSLL